MSSTIIEPGILAGGRPIRALDVNRYMPLPALSAGAAERVALLSALRADSARLHAAGVAELKMLKANEMDALKQLVDGPLSHVDAYPRLGPIIEAVEWAGRDWLHINAERYGGRVLSLKTLEGSRFYGDSLDTLPCLQCAAPVCQTSRDVCATGPFGLRLLERHIAVFHVQDLQRQDYEREMRLASRFRCIVVNTDDNGHVEVNVDVAMANDPTADYIKRLKAAKDVHWALIDDRSPFSCVSAYLEMQSRPKSGSACFDYLKTLLAATQLSALTLVEDEAIHADERHLIDSLRSTSLLMPPQRILRMGTAAGEQHAKVIRDCCLMSFSLLHRSPYPFDDTFGRHPSGAAASRRIFLAIRGLQWPLLGYYTVPASTATSSTVSTASFASLHYDSDQEDAELAGSASDSE